MAESSVAEAPNRMKRFVHALGSAYGVLAATSLFLLASVPLALSYLSKEEFGVWAVMTQLSGYLALIDLGIASSTCRLLFDHKDRPESGEYGGLIRTAWLTSLAQGFILAIVGVLVAPLAADWLGIPADLRASFIGLLEWQCVMLVAGFAIRPLCNLLYVHQRIDISNYAQMAGCAVNFVVMWAGFDWGWGIYSLVWGGLAGWLIHHGLSLAAVWWLKLLPQSRRAWGQPSWSRFKEVFGLGRELFLIVLGMQLIDASQVIVISRVLGLEAAALWAVGTKAYQLLVQLQGRLLAMSVPAFAEMMVRGEQERLRRRFRTLAMAATSFAGFGGVGLILCNSAFVSLWTNGRMVWPVENDVLLALCVVVHALKNFHASFIPLTKQIGALKWVYFAEGSVFIALGMILVPEGGLPMLITLSVACTLACTLAYGVWRSGGYFGITSREILYDWLKPLGTMLSWITPVAALVLWGWWTQPPLERLLAGLVVGGWFGGWCFLRFGLPVDLKREIAERLPRRFARPFRWISGAGVATNAMRGK